jgi:hypothetical protein
MMHPDHYDLFIKAMMAGLAAIIATFAVKVGVMAAHIWSEP